MLSGMAPVKLFEGTEMSRRFWKEPKASAKLQRISNVA